MGGVDTVGWTNRQKDRQTDRDLFKIRFIKNVLLRHVFLQGQQLLTPLWCRPEGEKT